MNLKGSRPEEPADAASSGAGSVYQVVAVCILLVLAIGLVFGQTVHFTFVNLDDNVNVYQNPHVTGGLKAAEMKWVFVHPYMGSWIPLTWISHMFDCQIHGLGAGGHHLTNVVLHALTAIGLFLVLRGMTGRIWPSALVAAVFAVHPLRAESVAWITERKDVLSGLFFMLALAAYAGYARHPRSLLRYLAVLVAFGLGLMAKPMLVTLPLLLLLLDYWPLGRWANSPDSPANVEETGTVTAAAESGRCRRRWRLAARLVLEKVPLLGMAAFSCFMTIRANDSELSYLLENGFSLSARLGNAAVACVTYPALFFYPAKLAAIYPLPSHALSFWKTGGALLILAVATLAAIVWRRSRPYLLVGWLWYVGMLVPVSGVVQVGMQAVADRFTYLPQIGLCLALAWGAADLIASEPRLRMAGRVAAPLLVAVLAACAWRQTSYWHDSLTLWNRTLACTSANKMAHNSLGNAYLDLQQFDQAIEQYRAATAIDPAHAMSHFNLGVALAATGRLEEAIEEYEEVVRLQPGHAAAHNNLCNALLTQGRLAAAMEHCQAALKIDPQFAEAHYNAGAIWYMRGRMDEAIAELRLTLAANPQFAEAHYPLGLALAQRGRLDDAIGEYRMALETQPDCHAEIHNSLGLALAARGRADDAVEEFQKALDLRPDFTEARLNLMRTSAGRKRLP